MFEYDVSKQFGWSGKKSERVISVMKMFGLDVQRLKDEDVCHQCKVSIAPGEVCFVTGASGSGKSVILKQMYEQTASDDRVDLDEIGLDSEKTVIDTFEGDVFDGLRTLSFAGMSDVLSVLKQPDKLSEGQKYRYKLAKALACGKKIIFADEFCSNLDRVTACVIAYHVRKFAKRTGTSFVLASAHDDLLGDLLPDVIVIKHLAGDAEVVYRDGQRRLA